MKYLKLLTIIILIALIPSFTSSSNYVASTVDLSKISYDGFITYLVLVGNRTAEVYVRPDIDCGLQAFDIYLNTPDYEVDSQYDLIRSPNGYHFLSLGFETEMQSGADYKIATIHFDSGGIKKIVRADFAIAYTPAAPEVDESCYEWSIEIK